MKQTIVFFILSMLATSFDALSQTMYVIVISIDGLRPEFYQDTTWPAPHLQRLAREGVAAHHMKSVFPSFTYPSHVAMLTGALPIHSGISYNAKPGQQDWYWFTKDIKVP